MEQGVPQGFPQGGPPGGFPGGRPPGGRPGGLRMLMFAGPAAWIILAATLLVLGIAFYQIYKKAGFNGLLGLLMFIPLVNLGMLLWFAFTEWPIFKKMRELQALASMRADGVIAAPAPVAAAVTAPAPVEVPAAEAGEPPTPAPPRA